MGCLKVWNGSEWVEVAGTVSDHGLLSGLTDDDHGAYPLTDGTRGFLGTVSGVDPVDDDDLSTKNYIDTTHSADSSAHHIRYTQDENDAIIGGTNVTVVSGSNIITISSTGGSGGSGGSDTAIAGADGITVISGVPTEGEVTVSGFRTEFVSASGSLQTQIDTIDHGDLEGLSDDDHPQYHNDTRGDARYHTQTELNSTFSGSPGLALVGFPTVSGFVNAAPEGDVSPSAHGAHFFFNSAGWITGGVISDLGDETILVTSGIGAIRTAATALSPIAAFGWPETSGIAIPTDSVRYIGVNYDSSGDTSTVVSKTTDTWNYYTNFPLGFVSNRENTLHPINVPHTVGDGIDLVNQRLDALQGIVRDAKVGGLLIGETGTRNVTLGAGTLWLRLDTFPINALDTSAADDFDTYYRDGVGGFTKVPAETQWDNDSYDDNSGTLVSLTNNRWAVLWFYVELDNHLAIVYGREQYTSVASAEGEAVPSTLPVGFPDEAFLLGRFIFQKGASTAESIQAAFDTTFSTTGVTAHVDLSGLLSDDHTQYSLADGTRAFTGTVGGIDPVASADLATKNYVDSADTTISGHLQSEIDAVEDNDTISNALVGSDGITVTSGDPTDTIEGFHAEFVLASGTLDSEKVDKAGDTMTGDLVMDLDTDPQIILASGTQFAPSIAFGSDLDTGLYSSSPEVQTLVLGGFQSLTLTKTGVFGFTPFHSIDGGSASSPAFTFFTDTNTGIYGTGSDNLSFATGGTRLFRLESSFAGFEITVSGVDPVASSDLTTKNYVDTADTTISGHLSTEIDSDISTHAGISNAHHDKYTDAEAITALEPITSELAASGVALSEEIASASGTLDSDKVDRAGDTMTGTLNISKAAAADAFRITDTTNSYYIEIGHGNTVATIDTHATTALLAFRMGTTDIMSLLPTGEVGIGTTAPAVPLHVVGGTDASVSDGAGYMVIGTEGSTNIVFDNNEIMARNNAATSELLLNADGGIVSIHGNDASTRIDFTDDGDMVMGGGSAGDRRIEFYNSATLFATFGFDTSETKMVLAIDAFGSNDTQTWTATEIAFFIGATQEVSLTADTLTFNNGGTDTQIDWGTSGQLGLQINGTDAITMTQVGTTITGDLTLSEGDNYVFTKRSTTALTVQNTVEGSPARFELFAGTGDGGDDVVFAAYGLGTPASVTNRERLLLGYDTSDTRFAIQSEANGTGTVRPLVIFTEGNTDQLKLETDGSVSFASTITAPTGTFSESLTVSGLPVSVVDSSVEVLAGMIETPAVKSYTLDQSAKYAYTVDDLTYITVTGTVTGTLMVEGAIVEGLDNLSMGISENTGVATSNNSVTLGDTLTLTLSGVVDVPGDLSFSLQTTRAA